MDEEGLRGKPVIAGRWYWEPKPEMSRLDASQPGAEKWIEETFARLKSEGVSYFKVDFIAGAPSLGRAMAAVRRGAGADAWTRFVMTPPLLSVGLANGVCVGPDTMDAGVPDWIKYERENDPLLAASYWVNDRLYHREICDMSVGMKADVEEARFRLAMMTLSGSGISFSDDFRELKLPRIRMMQQCLPPGNPLARPLDLFDREMPSLWHVHCKNQSGGWDAVGLFNFDGQPHDRTVRVAGDWTAGRRRGHGVRVLGGEVPRFAQGPRFLVPGPADRPHSPDPPPAGPSATDRHQYARAGRIPRDHADRLGREAVGAFGRVPAGSGPGRESVPLRSRRLPPVARIAGRQGLGPADPGRQEPLGAGGPLRAGAAGLGDPVRNERRRPAEHGSRSRRGHWSQRGAVRPHRQRFLR